MNDINKEIPKETELSIIKIVDSELTKRSQRSFFKGVFATLVILPIVYFGIAHLAQLAAEKAANSEMDKRKGAWEATFNSIIDKAATSVIQIEHYKQNADVAAVSASDAAEKLKQVSADISKALGLESKEQLIEAIAQSPTLQNSLLPIGSIVAWHKDFPNTQAIPAGWIECNGQRINDSKSPFHNLIVPNLNSAVGYSAGRFL